ncbi:M15 family metallopeptidase [Agromyces subbeticus]|uniref:M15 family metallopeptidase n=1 Tax=Agromyces subbeticus TaxID=293890 RepID=UPI000406CBF7|nr:M15 family metallopeptidase [Agromyces subbeticus]
MSHTTARRRRFRRFLGFLLIASIVVAAAIIGTLAAQPDSSAARAIGGILQPDDADRPVTEADGVLPDGARLTDTGYPGIGKLDPALVQALGEAAADAADDGVEFLVNDGWRSPAYQEQLLRDAIASYGSEEEARRWVASPETSAHVSGAAVDIGPFDGTYWLSQHGAEYGICQVYVNEPWHFELIPEAVDHGCPSMHADPTEDPRMQQ